MEQEIATPSGSGRTLLGYSSAAAALVRGALLAILASFKARAVVRRADIDLQSFGPHLRDDLGLEADDIDGPERLIDETRNRLSIPW